MIGYKSMRGFKVGTERKGKVIIITSSSVRKRWFSSGWCLWMCDGQSLPCVWMEHFNNA